MKKQIWMIAFVVCIASASTWAWFDSLENNISPSKKAEEIKSIKRFPKELLDILEKINQAHLKLDNYQLSHVTEKEANILEEGEYDSVNVTISGKKIRFDQHGVIKMQNGDEGLLVFPPEKIMVLQEIDDDIFDKLKNYRGYFKPDSMAGNLKSYEIKNGAVTINFIDFPISKMTIEFNPKTYLMQKITNVQHIENPDSDPITITETNTLTYQLGNAKSMKKWFDMKQFLMPDSKYKYHPHPDYSGYTVYNNTIKALKHSKSN